MATRAQFSGELALQRRQGIVAAREGSGWTKTLVCGLLDMAALWGAWTLTIEARVALNPWMDLRMTRGQLAEAAPPVAAVLLLWGVCAWWLGVYKKPYRRLRDKAARVVETALIAGALSIVATFVWREFGFEISRSFVLLYPSISLVTLGLGRGVAETAIRRIGRQWPAPERVAVIGWPAEARAIVERLRNEGHRVVPGVILPRAMEGSAVPVRVLGVVDDVGAIINGSELSRLVIVNQCLAREDEERCSRTARRMGVCVNHTIGMTTAELKYSVVELGELSLLEIRPAGLRPGQERVKRVFDVVVAGATLVALAPLLALIALAVWASSPGPVFYIASRVGLGGKRFPFFKFRSMYTAQDWMRKQQANEKSGHIYKVKGDKRITPVGRILRRYSLDELPQLFNVLRGEMSLVGPRPLPAEDLDADGMSREFYHWAEHRSRVLPGITGLWQVRGRSELGFDAMLQLDVEYIQTWSLAADFRILAQTPLVVITGRGAY